MFRASVRLLVMALLVVAGFGLLMGTADAQTDPGPDPVVQIAQDADSITSLNDSNTQVRRAVIGLVMVAALTGIVGAAYWYYTGIDARARFAAANPGVQPASRFSFGRSAPVQQQEPAPAAVPPTTRGRTHLTKPVPPPEPEPVGRHAAPAHAAPRPASSEGEGLFDDPQPARRRRAEPASSLWDGSDGQARGPAAAAARGWPARTPRHTRPLAPTEEELFDYAAEPPQSTARFRPETDDLFDP